MQEKISKTLIGYIFVVTFLNKNSYLINGQCSEIQWKEEFQMHHISCEGHFDVVPNDINPNVQSLMFLHCKIKIVRTDSFYKLKKLESLKIINTDVTEVKDKNFLLIPTLTMLEIKNCTIPSLEQINFPISLTSLNITNSEIKSLNIEKCQRLLYIDLSGNNLRRLPSLPNNPPLQYMILDDNKFIGFTAYELMALCRLKIIRANSYRWTRAKYPIRYCNCKLVKFWLERRNITNNIKVCNIEKRKNPEPKCNFTLNEKAIERFHDCLLNAPLMERTNSTPYYFVLVFIIMFAIIAASVYYFVFREEGKTPVPPEINEETEKNYEADNEEVELADEEKYASNKVEEEEYIYEYE